MPNVFSHKLNVRWILILLINLMFNQAIGQLEYFRFGRTSEENTLRQNTILSIDQDEFGYLWLGTLEGVYRYDGYELKEVFKKDQQFFNHVNNIATDKNFNVWINSTTDGLFHYNLKNHKTQHVNFGGVTPPYETIKTIYNSNGLNWFITNRQNLFTLDSINGIPHFPLKDQKIKSVKEFRQFVFVNTIHEFKVYNSKTKKWILIEDIYPGIPKVTGKINKFYACKNEILWLESNQILYYNKKTGKKHTWAYTDYPFVNSVSEIIKDFQGIYWIATYGNGLIQINPKNKKLTHFTTDKLDNQSLIDDFIYSLFLDKEGIVWVGTKRGLSFVDPLKNKFRYLNPNSIAQNKVKASVNNVFSLEVEKGDTILWIGSTKALERVNLKTGKGHVFINPLSSTANAIDALKTHSKDKIWVGTHEGLFLFDLKTEQFKKHVFNANKKNREGDFVTDIHQLNKEELFIATYDSGIFRYNLKTKKSEQISSDQKVYFIKELDGTIFMGGNNGLYQWNKKTEQFNTYLEDELEKRIITYIEETDFFYWIGTSSGLVKMNKKSKKLSVLNVNNLNGFIYAIQKDLRSNLWVSTNFGLIKYHTQSGEVEQYNKEKGVQDDEFNSASTAKLANGNLLFGGINGISLFDPLTIRQNKIVPDVVITGINVFNKPLKIETSSNLNTDVNIQEEIVFSYLDYSFSFSFAALSFSSPDEIQYAYKLDGFEEEWNYVDSKRRFASYTNIKAGTYTLMINASNADGIWNTNPKTIKIVITPPFWKTTWFRIVTILLIAFCVIIIIQYRTYKLEKERQLLQRKVKERTKDLHAEKEKLELTLKELKTTQMKLVESEKMASLGLLTAGIAHEINNSINYIQGAVMGLELTLADMKGILSDAASIHPTDNNYAQKAVEWNKKYHQKDFETPINELLACIKTGAEQSTEIVKGLKSYSRSDGSVNEWADINGIIKSSLLIVKKEAGARVQVNFDNGEVPKLFCKPGKLNQVILNLIVNAIHAIDGEGNINIASKLCEHKGKEFVRLSVSDTGRGISEDIRSKIFDPFFTTKGFGKGSGLGLSISQGIIMDHGGDIEVESTVGIGTTFYLYLPLAKQLINEEK